MTTGFDRLNFLIWKRAALGMAFQPEFKPTNQQTMNIIYLHGLDSKLSPEKKSVLEQFGNMYAPDVNYYEDRDAIQTILDYYPNLEIDAVIGSSMGGFAGYHVANALDKPALLFNPAVKKRSVHQNIPSLNSFNRLKQIVIGQVDEVVIPRDTLEFLLEDFNPVTDLRLHLVPGLGHNIPVEFFKEEVSSFFANTCFNRKINNQV